jgi:hypothetical protein
VPRGLGSPSVALALCNDRPHWSVVVGVPGAITSQGRFGEAARELAAQGHHRLVWVAARVSVLVGDPATRRPHRAGQAASGTGPKTGRRCWSMTWVICSVWEALHCCGRSARVGLFGRLGSSTEASRSSPRVALAPAGACAESRRSRSPTRRRACARVRPPVACLIRRPVSSRTLTRQYAAHGAGGKPGVPIAANAVERPSAGTGPRGHGSTARRSGRAGAGRGRAFVRTPRP